MALENITPELTALTTEVVERLRNEQGTRLSEISGLTRRLYSDLAGLCMDHVINNPKPEGLRKLGPTEDAYGLDVLNTEDTYVRLNYYTGEGAKDVSADQLSASSLDTSAVGTPHNHIGDISGVFPRGGLTHKTFGVEPGKAFTAGNIRFDKQPGSTTSTTFFVPRESVKLTDGDYAAFSEGEGYNLDRDTPHVVAWSEPTISVWINDHHKPLRPSTTYNPCGFEETEGRPRGLAEAEQARIWTSLSSLILTGKES
jgi:hypothetical protein